VTANQFVYDAIEDKTLAGIAYNIEEYTIRFGDNGEYYEFLEADSVECIIFDMTADQSISDGILDEEFAKNNGILANETMEITDSKMKGNANCFAKPVFHYWKPYWKPQAEEHTLDPPPEPPPVELPPAEPPPKLQRKSSGHDSNGPILEQATLQTRHFPTHPHQSPIFTREQFWGDFFTNDSLVKIDWIRAEWTD